ncbi:unnamed protein product [Caenorhabditis auriculariae]|uniref:LysM domain-containing protein n=1 Tax=Caenorhabditis auriculariae TaxID=2777116 RepID=A0A8S1HRZ7_9PELO|nr:unnamed protein product [Caenorhabditis auriculariae]
MTEEQYAMRSRVGRTTSSESNRRNDSPNYKENVLIERKIKNGDTLNKLAIKYQVNVAEIKRVNNLVSEQDFLALSRVKIPVSRMRMALGVRTSSSLEDDEEDHVIHFNDRSRLINDEDDRSRDPSAEDIFHKTDTAIAQVREALPEDQIPGSFHFVDARPPDSGPSSVWVVVVGVVLIFIVLPLVLTFYEETEEAVHHQRPHRNLSH